MRPKILYSAMILVAAVVLAACNGIVTSVGNNNSITNNNSNSTNSAIGPETTYADGARRITTGELETLMKEGKAYVVDVRSQDVYDIGHIPGSRLIPAGLIEKHAKELPRDKTIVTYCS